MADAKQCDRCKNFYPRTGVRNDYVIRRRGSLYDIDLDLCDKCYSDLLKFLGIEKKEKKDGSKKSGKNSKG